MRTPALLLRLLLCLALVAGGVAGAQAQVRMAFTHAAMEAVMADGDGCHEAPSTPDRHGDCCDAAPCACPVPAMPLPVSTRLANVPPTAASPPRAGPSRHPAPRLGDPLRPPIG